MLSRQLSRLSRLSRLSQASSWRKGSVCVFCALRTQSQSQRLAYRSFHASGAVLDKSAANLKSPKLSSRKRKDAKPKVKKPKARERLSRRPLSAASAQVEDDSGHVQEEGSNGDEAQEEGELATDKLQTLKDAMLGGSKSRKEKADVPRENLQISTLYPEDLEFAAVEVEKPPVPMLSYGLDRVLFNPGIYRLQDPRSRVYNFDPYLEKIMPANEFDFDALSEYKTSSKDEDLLALTKRAGTRFTGSTSSMSSMLQHFHYVLSNFRKLNHKMLSRQFPEPSSRFSKITLGPSAVFLRYKDGVYAIDADKSYDTPNIMSWLGHSLEKLLTTERSEFERYRRSSSDKAPHEDKASRCYHYSKQGNMMMRSQLDAVDPRLPGTGVFDLKTRAVVSIRMNHKEYEQGSGYQLRHALGEWESFEREFYDMTRATMLKYSLQVRMGRMDGIFVAFHNIERIFGFQYLSLPDMDAVLHGQTNTRLGDDEFKLSLSLVDELLTKAVTRFPDTSIRLHFEAREAKTPFMYVFAEPVTEEQADEIQSAGEAAQKEFARNVVGVGNDDPARQAVWQHIQDDVDEQVDEDQGTAPEPDDQEETAKKEHTQTVSEDSTESFTQKTPEIDEASGVEESTEGTTRDTPAVDDASEPEESTEGTTRDTPAVDEASEPEESTEGTTRGTSDVDETSEVEESTEGTTQETPITDKAPNPTSSSEGPLIGWTLTVRNLVNGGYVERPENLDADDEWKIEYYVKEIPEEASWRLYNALKERRRQLIGLDDEEVSKGLKHYRDLIQRFSDRGRKWRIEQDKLNEAKGTEMYRPLGPGHEPDGVGSYNEVTKDEKSPDEAIEAGESSVDDTKANESLSREKKEEVLDGMPASPS
ncbi:Pet127-domain-containing protein [Decorospora gaudefroyi]|uniref:Pet127-domain-containing protein n=1 Tax=Decorospora gaudefroyi TaxID=184978 RepID=A0A6A5KL84_9PLEO|nr:Pet127-domain-containing protein [Decorospora gaudefroyi]